MHSCVLRGEYQRNVDGQLIEADTLQLAVARALVEGQAGQVIDWTAEGRWGVAILDIDWHDTAPPADSEALMRGLSMQPCKWWVSRGGGLHLLFEAIETYQACDLAAIAGLHFLLHSDCTGVEILPRTRIPEHPIHEENYVLDLVELRRWLASGGTDPEAVRNWCEERHVKRGGRLGHEHCVIDPRPNATGGKPVSVRDDGLHCFVCSSHTGHGFRPWGAVLGLPSVNKACDAAKHFVNWDNVRHYLSQQWGLRASEDMLRSLYSAVLNVLHRTPRGDPHPFIGMCFADNSMILGESGIWLNAKTFEPVTPKLEAFANWPSVLYATYNPDGEYNKAKRDTTRYHEHLTPGLKPRGFPEHKVVRGVKLWGQNLDYGDKRVAVTRSSEDAPPVRYEEEKDRRPIEWAWHTVEQYFPGINRNYLLLLIAARAHAESGIGPVPQLLVTGPSGSGKSATLRLAAELVDDTTLQIMTEDASKFELAFGEACAGGHGWIALEEFAKGLVGAQAINCFNRLLLTDRRFYYKRMYVGPVSVSVQSVVALTNVSWSREVLLDTQIGRRFVRVHLTNRVPNWERTLAPFGIDRWRSRHPDNARAANTIISHVVDRWFTGAAVLFKDIATELGFCTQEEAAQALGGVSTTAMLRELFDAVCNEPPCTLDRWSGKGWKVVENTDFDHPFMKLWVHLRDDAESIDSRKVDETDLQAILDLAYPAVLERSRHGRYTGFRFVIPGVNPRSREFKVNEELKKSPSSDSPTPSPPASPLTPSVSTQKPDELSLEGDYIYVDLETRSECDLRVKGSRQYAKDPTTSIMCACFLSEEREGPVVWVWEPGRHLDEVDVDMLWPRPTSFPQLPVRYGMPPNLENRVLVAHNAEGFDRLVWEALGYPAPRGWVDSLPLARAAGLPGALDKIGKQLFGEGKDEGADLTLRFSKPMKNGKFLPITTEAAKTIVRYCIKDVLITAYMFEQEHLQQYWREQAPQWAAHIHVDRKGIYFDRKVAEVILAHEEQLQKDTIERIERLTDGELKGNALNRQAFLLGWLKERGLELPDLQKQTIFNALEGRDASNEEDEDEDEGKGEAAAPIDPVVYEVLKARVDMVKITAAKLRTALAACDGNRLHGTLEYHAAHTGRWGGRLFQPHNLPRGVQFDLLMALDTLLKTGRLPRYDGSPSELLGSLLRLCIAAPPGKVLGIADFAKIELCGVSWLAGETSLLETIQAGGDPYKWMAARLFNVPESEVKKEQRQLGKNVVLGCGYQLGASGFAKYSASNGVDLQATGLTPAQIINTYRNSVPKIAGHSPREFETEDGRKLVARTGGLWKRFHHHAHSVAANETKEKGVFSREGPHMLARLPSGRCIVYRNARIEEHIPGYFKQQGIARTKPTIVFDHPQYGASTTYGGKLVENYVQAFCRDLLAQGLVNLCMAGMTPVLHVHDEIICEIDEAQADEQLDRMGQLMVAKPDWAEEMPVKAEGFWTPRYMKAPPPGQKERKW